MEFDMKLLVFTVFDSMAEAYLQPFYSATVGLAIRSFSEAVNTSGHQFQKYSSDFTLFQIGEFDDSNGFIKMDDFRRIGVAQEFVDQVVSGGLPPTPIEEAIDGTG
ncbi:nonstructural protein [Microviridae sp.]|nr:nonstructural protein [Microviridae sp.]